MSRIIREVPFITRDSDQIGVPSQELFKEAGKSVANSWKDYLDTFAPRGITARGKQGSPNDINDAYRHYMSAALLTHVLGGDLTFNLGDLNEKINNAYSSESTKMDYANNDAGIAAGDKIYNGFEASMAFVSDVATGKVKIIDPETKEIRETNVRDLPSVREPYQREKSADDFSGRNPGTMEA